MAELVDCAPLNGDKCFYCDARVYGANDTDEHSPDCELWKAQEALAQQAPQPDNITGFPIVVDPTMPEHEIELRSPSQSLRLKIAPQPEEKQ